VTTTETVRARNVVLRHALDDADAAELLAMLGLANTSRTAAGRRTRVEQLVHTVTAADRPMQLGELRALLGWPGAAVELTAGRAARAGLVARPRTGWYGPLGCDCPEVTRPKSPCGTPNAYHHGCRCSDCRAASAASARRLRASRRARRRRIKGRLVAVDAPRHGLNTAQKWGCQCHTCAEAVRLNSLQRRQAARAATRSEVA
jgi:hypothetical protein